MPPRRVAVVGAGLAGLSAAVELKRLGHEVSLFERSRLLGGKATSFVVDGVEVDNGQHVFLACCTEFIDFVHQIQQQTSPNTDLLFLQDRFEARLLGKDGAAHLRAAPLPPPWHLALGLLGYRHLGLLDRLRVGQAILAARRPALPRETFSAWLERHRQSPAARAAFWDPFMVPALNASLEEASAETALMTITTAFLSDSGAARFGFARVPLARIAEAATRSLDRVVLRTPVVGLDWESSTARALVLDDGSRFACDAIVLAVPPARLQRILGDETLGPTGLGDFDYAPIVDVHLWYNGPALGFGFAALLGSPVQWVFEKSPGYLCCSLSAAEEYVSMPNDELIQLCRHEVEGMLPELSTRAFLRGAATRDREATFVPSPHLARPGPVTALRNVVIAGAWTDTGWPATMESAVRSGRAAVRELAGVLDELVVPVG